MLATTRSNWTEAGCTRTLVAAALCFTARPDFRRGSNLLQIGGGTVSARQVVNILGRWNASADWDSIGLAGKMDDFSSGDYYEDEISSFKTDFSAGAAYYMARRPQRRAFCKKYSLVQRWVHAENVGTLPFEDAALAASVGATVDELNAEPIDPLAAEVVFDALCGSMAGFVDEAECDERRQSFIAADGSFDSEQFGASLDATRAEILRALAIFPGIWILVLGLIANRWLPIALSYLDTITNTISENVEANGPSALLLPAWGVLGVALSLLVGTRTSPGLLRTALMGKEAMADGEYVLDYKERAILEQDELYLQRMARRKRGEEGSAREEIETNMGMANYLQRVMSVEFVTASLKKMLQPPKADDARERYRRTPERRKRGGEKDFSIR